MRISSTYQSYDYSTLYNAQSVSSNTETTDSLLSKLLSEEIKTTQSVKATDTSSVKSLGDLLTEMDNQPSARNMRPKPPEPDEAMVQMMETVSNTDISSLNFEEKKTLLSGALTALSKNSEDASKVSSLTEEEVDKALTNLQTLAKEGPKGKPPGPPPGGKPSGVSETKSSQGTISLEALLKALEEAEDEEDDETEEKSIQTIQLNAIKNAISSYMKSMNAVEETTTNNFVL